MPMPGLLASWVVTVLLLQSPAATDTPGSGKTRVSDPNERICEDLTIVGSRLAVRRVCGTRAEWAERKRLDREAIDRAQTSPCMITGTNSRGRPSC